MFSPPLVPGGRVIYPLSAAFHGRAVSMPNGKAKFLKKFLRTAKMRPPARRGRAQRKYEQYLDVLTVHLHNRNTLYED